MVPPTAEQIQRLQDRDAVVSTDVVQERARAARHRALQLREQAAAAWHRVARLEVELGCLRMTGLDRGRLRQRLQAAEVQVANLRRAQASNRRIGMAIGILMARHGLTEQGAFELLRAASNHFNVKLREVAEEVIYTGTLGVDGDARTDGMRHGPADLSTSYVADEGRVDAVRAEGPP